MWKIPIQNSYSLWELIIGEREEDLNLLSHYAFSPEVEDG